MEIKPQLSVSQWVGIPNPIRKKLHIIFNLKRSTGAEVSGGVCVCDGHTMNDLTGINLETMNKYLGEDYSDFYDAFNACVEKAGIEDQEPIENAPQAIVVANNPIPEAEYIPPKPSPEAIQNIEGKKRQGRPRKIK